MTNKKQKAVLVLKTVKADMTGNGGFKYPKKGKVEAPDWKPTKECGNGLHGFLGGIGDGSLADWSDDANWLVLQVPIEGIIDLGGKIKFPSGFVVHCGDRNTAINYLQKHGCNGLIIGGTATAGDCGTATAGDCGTATAGDCGILNIRWWDGKRYRLAIFYVGENGIKPNTAYRVDAKGDAVEVAK